MSANRQARLGLVALFGSSKVAPTILVVDDEPDVLQLIESILTEGGYTVVAVRSADSAILAFDSMPHCPDLVLTDVVMPGMSGPMLVDHLLSKRPNLKVLFMSGYDDRQVVQKYVVEKGFRLLPKPFTIKALRSAIQAEIEASGEPERKG